jgi:uncharacterized protein (DUF885 family)
VESVGRQDPNNWVARLGARYHEVHYAADPIAATVDGVAGYDHELPDPSRAADERVRQDLEAIATDLAEVDPARLDGEDFLSHQTLAWLLRGAVTARRHGLTEVAVSASVAGVFPALVSVIPAASVATPSAAQAYLDRLAKLGEFFDRLGERQREAGRDGRTPTATGVRQAITQLDGYLARPVSDDPFLSPQPGDGVDAPRWRARAGELLADVVRPAIGRYQEMLRTDLLPIGRSDDEVGVGHLPGGSAGYRDAVAAHTTTDLTPEQIHATGETLVAGLREEFAERGGRALGTTDVAEVLRRLRDDPDLRFRAGDEIVATVTDALRRAEAALPGWFREYHIAPCTVRVMDAAEAENSVPGYYTPPAADGSRPGAHVVNLYAPDRRPRFEYEALAFHESVPGHHLQIAVAQTLSGLPEFRRFAYLTAHGEGWGLYVERLCDEMGLYTDDLSRLGMVSFDAWRACRLVVDTGMHHFGWSRQRAIDYMRDNTALPDLTITNEVDRYIADPGQALGYMIGRIRIRALRDRSAQRPTYDLRTFHHEVIGHGTLPLDTLDAHLDRVFPTAK